MAPLPRCFRLRLGRLAWFEPAYIHIGQCCQAVMTLPVLPRMAEAEPVPDTLWHIPAAATTRAVGLDTRLAILDRNEVAAVLIFGVRHVLAFACFSQLRVRFRLAGLPAGWCFPVPPGAVCRAGPRWQCGCRARSAISRRACSRAGPARLHPARPGMASCARPRAARPCTRRSSAAGSGVAAACPTRRRTAG